MWTSVNWSWVARCLVTQNFGVAAENIDVAWGTSAARNIFPLQKIFLPVFIRLVLFRCFLPFLRALQALQSARILLRTLLLGLDAARLRRLLPLHPRLPAACLQETLLPHLHHEHRLHRRTQLRPCVDGLHNR